ncbi:HipA domain-containing protein [Pseudomonas sp. LB1P83]
MKKVEYVIYDVSSFQSEQVEPLGTKSKYWYSGADGKDYLFKSIETYDANKQLVTRGGEDWSEKISCELAKFLSVPCAEYDLAHNGLSRGVITRNFIAKGGAYLVTGNEVLNNYSPPIAVVGPGRIEQQDIMNVYNVLRRVVRNKPAGFNSLPGIKTAADFFAGYLMLDALISNQDRHSENWGLIVIGKRRFHLAPTFDHAASLARNESDLAKEERLLSLDVGQQVSTYVRRAKSYFYLRGKRLRTLRAFEYFGVLNPVASIGWIEQLRLLTPEVMQAILSSVPEGIMSDVSKKFAFEMLVCNKANIMALEPFFEKNLDPLFRRQQIKNYE